MDEIRLTEPPHDSIPLSMWPSATRSRLGNEIVPPDHQVGIWWREIRPACRYQAERTVRARMMNWRFLRPLF